MGNVQLVLLNQSLCILDLQLSEAAPYYSQQFVRPGESMTRCVGRVWFTITANPWIGDGPTDPYVIYSQNGKNYTAVRQIAIDGVHSNLLQRPIPRDKLTELEKRLIEHSGYPFYISSEGWYMGSGRTITIFGGPNCRYEQVSYESGGRIQTKYLQIFDDTKGLGDLYFRGSYSKSGC